MTEKTPEQIASEATTGEFWVEVDPYGIWEEGRGDALRKCIATAIEIDRAQRAHGWPTPTDPATLKPGDRVRLTGRDWFDLKRRIVVIAGVADSGPNLAPTPYFYEDGVDWLIWSDDSTDYSVTKVEGD